MRRSGEMGSIAGGNAYSLVLVGDEVHAVFDYGDDDHVERLPADDMDHMLTPWREHVVKTQLHERRVVPETYRRNPCSRMRRGKALRLSADLARHMLTALAGTGHSVSGVMQCDRRAGSSNRTSTVRRGSRSSCPASISSAHARTGGLRVVDAGRTRPPCVNAVPLRRLVHRLTAAHLEVSCNGSMLSEPVERPPGEVSLPVRRPRSACSDSCS